MRLFIAEKASLARALAEALGTVVKKDKLSITLSSGDIVCWAAGHILELPTPEVMDPNYKSWNLGQLPIIPSDWKLLPKAPCKDLLGNIGRLLKEAKIVVNAGDADREGQLLIDEILEHFKYKGTVLRILVTDMNATAIRKALDEMRPNHEYKNLSLSAAARQRADWLLGINMTRLFTVTTPRQRGTVLSVGRVQTPTLALVVERDRQIENFTPTPFFVVKARSVVSNGEFIATWRPAEDRSGLDSEGRIVDAKIIDDLERKLAGKIGRVTKFSKKKSLTQPPITYSLSALQIDASKKYGYSPDETLKLLQSLYEAKLATYPRSDCGYLPESLYENRAAVIKTICDYLPNFKQYKFDLGLKSSAWDSSKTAEHHGIVPTGTIPADIPERQKDIYDLIARRYAAQFMPAQEFAVVELEYIIQDELFSTRTKQCSYMGWYSLYSGYLQEEEDKEESASTIPDAQVGENVGIREIIRENKKTTPPKRFTEASLLAAMNNIHKYVSDPEMKKILKETLGIGTAATQAKIIDTLINGRGYITKDKKVLVSTQKGRDLIDAVDETLRKPDTTALWEQRLGEIQEGKNEIDLFIRDITETIKDITTARAKASPEVRSVAPQNDDEGQAPCPACDGRMRQLSGKFGKFWVCGKCGISLQDDRGKPQKTAKCPACGQLARRIKKDTKHFWGCTNKACGKTYSDDKGKLVPKK